MNALVHAHSGLRWVVLILLLVAIARAFARKNSGLYEKPDKMINLFTMVSLHIQLLLGLVLYVMNIGVKINFNDTFMANPQSRILGLEHILGMLIAITLVTIGRGKAERASDPAVKHGTIAKWYIIGLLLILASIPWPFRNIGSGWF